MERRRFLAVGAGGLGLLAGCYSGDGDGGGPTATETPDLGIGIDSVEESDEGGLVVVLSVLNETDGTESGTVAVTVTLGENDTTTATTEVSVAADGEETVRVSFPNITREEFQAAGTVTASVR